MKLSDKAYQILKWILCIAVDAVIVLLSTLQNVWNWNIPMDSIITTIAAVSVFVGALFGISCYNYSKGQKEE